MEITLGFLGPGAGWLWDWLLAALIVIIPRAPRVRVAAGRWAVGLLGNATRQVGMPVPVRRTTSIVGALTRRLGAADGETASL